MASPRKASVLFTRASWVAWHIWRWLASDIRSIITCQTFCARVWYTFAAWVNSVHTQVSAISSLAFTRSYMYLVPSTSVRYACSICCICWSFRSIVLSYSSVSCLRSLSAYCCCLTMVLTHTARLAILTACSGAGVPSVIWSRSRGASNRSMLKSDAVDIFSV